MLECKCKRHETTGFFFPWYRGVDAPPNPRWSTHTRVSLSCFTKEQVITKNDLSPSPERRASHRAQTSCLGAPTNSKSSQRTSRSSRPVRCRQTPRVTNFLHLTYTQMALTQAHLLHLQRMDSSRLKYKQNARSSLVCSMHFLFFSRVASSIQGVKRRLK